MLFDGCAPANKITYTWTNPSFKTSKPTLLSSFRFSLAASPIPADDELIAFEHV